MNMLIRKIATGATSVSLLGSIFTIPAFADIQITDNGAHSTSTVSVTVEKNCEVKQKNKTYVESLIDSKASTGGNSANHNTGSSVLVDTGNATSSVGIAVDGGSNTATNPCCCQCDRCDGVGPTSLHDVLISGNGHGSSNHATVSKTKSSYVYQKNKTRVLTLVSSRAKTGKNSASGNTDGGGTVDVKTGNAVSTADVVVTAPSNNLNP